MRIMIVIKPRFPLPPELAPSLVDGFVAWWDRYRDRWESAGFFAGGGGGGGICNVADLMEFHTMMQEWPFTPFNHFDIHPLIDMDEALDHWKSAITAPQSS